MEGVTIEPTSVVKVEMEFKEENDFDTNSDNEGPQNYNNVKPPVGTSLQVKQEKMENEETKTEEQEFKQEPEFDPNSDNEESQNNSIQPPLFVQVKEEGFEYDEETAIDDQEDNVAVADTREDRVHPGGVNSVGTPPVIGVPLSKAQQTPSDQKKILTEDIHRPHQCDQCQRTFVRKIHLLEHMRTHTGERPYQCDVCQRTFIVQSHLLRHKRTHTGERPHQCDICNRTFIQKTHILAHMRIHTGERAYQCDICKKNLVDKTSYSRHMKTHTGERQYRCDRCTRTYILKKHLFRHMKTHAGELPLLAHMMTNQGEHS